MVTLNFAKPFIKWVGGKRQIIGDIELILPPKIDVYIEPFLGGGALFFHLARRVDVAHLSDINGELINAYSVVRGDLDGLISELSKYQNTREEFEEIRSADRLDDYEKLWSPVSRAARFIYLNKTCFNGLYRVNAKGQFNNSYGYYEKPKILDVPTLHGCHQTLNGPAVELAVRGFDDTLKIAREASSEGKAVFVYLDPPYLPISDTSAFTQYTKEDFSYDDHVRLKGYCDQLTAHKIMWMQSNSCSPRVQTLYKDYRITEVYANRKISAHPKGRLPVQELLISNYVPTRQIFGTKYA